MGYKDEFSLDLRLFLTAYPWRRIDPVPWTPLRKPLSECRVALISSASFILPGQEPFDESARGGDPTFREIPSETDVRDLIDTHPSKNFDHAGVRKDPNMALPIDRVRELVERGRIGSVNTRHFSFRGAILAPGRLMRDTAPVAARSLVEDGVDVALLVPV